MHFIFMVYSGAAFLISALSVPLRASYLLLGTHRWNQVQFTAALVRYVCIPTVNTLETPNKLSTCQFHYPWMIRLYCVDYFDQTTMLKSLLPCTSGDPRAPQFAKASLRGIICLVEKQTSVDRHTP
ncbi:hypothetical protein B0H34DRAFT_479824 [Crassisporium funariophilum]|nr:hypothetical protein B0H34DRAFT_479824 [Crassisporium funariophilum]